MQVPAHNPHLSPVAIDGDGRTLGGGEWTMVDADDETVQAGVADLRLVTFPDGLDRDAIDPAIAAQLWPASSAEGDASPGDRPGGSEAPTVPKAEKAASKRSASR